MGNYECCIQNTPPYNFGNLTNKIDSACLWPEKAQAVIDACGGQNVLECVCKDATAYGSYFGLFVQSGLLWVAIVTILFAILPCRPYFHLCSYLGEKEKE